ncbi:MULTISPECIES: (d)CMP kinase [Thermoactinomyces]|jgi:CMP/dCMP kinase|uniref:Cytidylate kinase n=1 Tax=Thermoactinomyces daqus TaxID=1329516 RepID=A0A7W2AIC6_9BACL|nr:MULTISPECIES: (d)CMP kinase [Thermoactinomyces]MBA4543120.1 (d)CMP kinase [Thermoactinomyces daqus]MBH8596645.1 (d)CMP kinase [Thermoactinomyces sp. CICC 10523]MBH8603407.1 (d)CMP kinase [Thermoactinomyces sp. CICC 10522]MBH8607826.1 (d)CMP kinase [Thermoactinomyces sp. CICC 10521]
MKRFLVAIDGPAGAGKSTVARQVAKRLGLVYIDTGAMYRALAWKALRDNIPLQDEESVTRLAESLTFTLHPKGISINGQYLSHEIRTPEISAAASTIARMLGVRRVLVNKQREIAEKQNVVMDGRDIGTNVLPHADLKIFLTASIEERAKRRYNEMKAKGLPADLEQLKKEIRERDDQDRTREHAPLKQADDALLLDTTHRSIAEIVENILQLCRNKLSNRE